MVFNSYAKINLSLNVIAKKKINLHEIQTFFCLIDLVDRIEIVKIKEKRDKVRFIGPFANQVDKSNNSIINLLKILRDLGLISNTYSIKITKNIPVFAGLGGGTGNATFVLKSLLKKKLNKKIINQVERAVGSDLKLFFYKQGFLKNLGNIIDIKKKQKLFFVLFQPKIMCSTQKIYSKVKHYSKKKFLNQNKINTRSKLFDYLLRSKNDLQSIVEKKYPPIKRLLKDISNQEGCHLSRMTGSGSVCYGLFKEQIAAKKALNKIKLKHPKIWSSFAKTV